MMQFDATFSFTVLVCCTMALLPTTKQASLNQDAMKSIRRVRSTENDNSTDINEWWCVEYNITKRSFEIQKELINLFNLDPFSQVSHAYNYSLPSACIIDMHHINYIGT